MSTAPALARIAGFVAAEADVAVILRRGPRKYVQMLVWDLATDEVQPGQWMRASVSLSTCNLSPDGRLFIGGYTDYSWRGRKSRADYYRGWTAISRPPYFTALAHWLDEYGSGGVWRSDTWAQLYVAKPYRPDGGELPSWLSVGSKSTPESPSPTRYPIAVDYSRGEDLLSVIAPETVAWSPQAREHIPFSWARAGWMRIAPGELLDLYPWPQDKERSEGDHRQPATDSSLTQASQFRVREEIWERRFSRGRLMRIFSQGSDRLELWDQAATTRLSFEGDWRFLALDHRERVIFADQGCLWIWEDFPFGAPRMIADLNAHTFEPITPPEWAREWPAFAPPR